MGDKTCPAAMHNYSGKLNSMFDHDCTLLVDHPGYHVCGRHHIDTVGGCTWVTGRFVYDDVNEYEPE